MHQSRMAKILEVRIVQFRHFENSSPTSWSKQTNKQHNAQTNANAKTNDNVKANDNAKTNANAKANGINVDTKANSNIIETEPEY